MFGIFSLSPIFSLSAEIVYSPISCTAPPRTSRHSGSRTTLHSAATAAAAVSSRIHCPRKGNQKKGSDRQITWSILTTFKKVTRFWAPPFRIPLWGGSYPVGDIVS